jgi:predicted nucleic acid-binding protein
MPPPGRPSRDQDDNILLPTAAAAQAAFLVTQDRDLLALERPSGVRVVTPVQLIRELRLRDPPANRPTSTEHVAAGVGAVS